MLDANNFFNRGRGIDLTSFKRSQFGGTISGPIRRDKTFFMMSYEGLRERGFDTRTFSVPTVLERRGDFSQTFAANRQLIQIFDPFSTRANGAGGFVRDTFAGNVIPTAKIDPVAANVMKYYPLPNLVGDSVTHANNYSQSGPHGLGIDQGDVRVDHNITDRQKFFARYSHRLTQDVPATLFPEEIAVAEGRINQYNRVRSAVADYTNTLSPTSILSGRPGLRAHALHLRQPRAGISAIEPGTPKDIDTAPDRAMFPRFGASGYTNLGGDDHRYSAFMSYTAATSLTKIHGRA